MSISDQLNQEARQRAEGRNRILQEQNKAIEDDNLANSPMYASVVQRVFKVVSTAIDTWKKEQSKLRASNQYAAYQTVKSLPSIAIAQIALKTLINGALSKNANRRSQLVTKVGRNIAEERRFRKFVKERPADFQAFKKASRRHTPGQKIRFLRYIANKHGYVPESNFEASKIGLTLYVLVNQATGLFIETTINDRKKTIVILELDPRFQELCLKNYERMLDRAYTDLPMLVQPEPWTRDNKGAYNTLPYNLITHSKRSEATQRQLCKNSLTAINAIQDTAWRVNTAVLERVKEVLANPNLASKLVKQEEELPEYLDEDASEEEKKANKRLIHKTIQDNLSARSKKLMVEKNLAAAEHFKGKTLYFPVYLDFRTRVYIKSTVLSPQGSDLQKGLIEFANGHKITDLRQTHWLLNHGANVYGIKGTFEEKVQAMQAMTNEIVEIAENRSNSWLEADEPVQFLAFCLEFYRLLNDGAGFETHLPIAVDGANNGTQILSILARDKELAIATNVANSDKPQDVYQKVIDVAMELILDKLDTISVSAQRLLSELKIDRSAAKKSTMCYPYSLSRHGAYGYIRAWFEEAIKEVKGQYTDKEKFDALVLLQETIWAAVLKVQGGAAKTMQFFQECAEAAMKADLEEIYWITPNGNKVYQHYKKVDANTVRTHVMGKTYVSTVIQDSNIVDKRRNLNGISPNVVHAIDASCLHETVAASAADGIENFAVVHDSFGTDATHIETLLNHVRKAYHTMLKGNYLADFRNAIREQVGPDAKLPKLPEMGDLNVDEILQSTYMFS